MLLLKSIKKANYSLILCYKPIEFYKNSHEGFDDKKIRDKGKKSNEKSIRKIIEKNKKR